MPHRIEFSRPAAKEIRALTPRVQRRIRPVIDALAENPRPRGTFKLPDGSFRIRIGTYRVVYDVSDSEQAILILRVRDRRDVYRRR